MRVVKLVLVSGTTQGCNGGQPASVVALWQSESIAGEIWVGARGQGTIERLGVHQVAVTYGQVVNS